MAIDGYPKAFEDLVATDLPERMTALETSIRSPIPMSDFAVEGLGPTALCRQFSLDSDFSGCYVLLEQEKPVYVGISGSVIQRLRQHVRGTTHFDASLAYRIAVDAAPHNHTRAKAMENKDFKAAFDSAKTYLRGLHVAWVKIENPLVLYVFEPYCAMKFDTSKWNTFETH